MNRTEIISEFTNNIESFKKFALNIAGEQDAPDLMQSCTLMLLEMNEERLHAAYNLAQGLKPYFIRMLCLQYKSKTSYFHRDYRKQDIELRKKAQDILLNEPQSETFHDELYFNKISEAVKTVYNNAESPLVADLEKIVWDLYIETGSLRKTLSGLPVQYAGILDLKSVHCIVQKFQRTIKKCLTNV